jgi:hypothetical protein
MGTGDFKMCLDSKLHLISAFLDSWKFLEKKLDFPTFFRAKYFKKNMKNRKKPRGVKGLILPL